MDTKRLHTYLFLFFACVIGTIGVVPMLSVLFNVPLTVRFFIVVLVQHVVVFGVMSWFTVVLAQRVGFIILMQQQPVGFNVKDDLIKPGIFAGVFVACVTYVLDILGVLFFYSLPDLPLFHLPIMRRLIIGCLAAFAGGTIEEVIRLFVMSLSAWLCMWIVPSSNKNKVIWASIIIAAFVGGIGHLPVGATALPGFIMMMRMIILNGIVGTVLGWLLWRKGLEVAMLAHFTADVLLHGPLAILYTTLFHV